LGIGEHKIPGGGEREIKRKVRGRERDDERGARERGATKREREIRGREGGRREKETEGREKKRDE
jgi:hypothetical protein